MIILVYKRVEEISQNDCLIVWLGGGQLYVFIKFGSTISNKINHRQWLCSRVVGHGIDANNGVRVS